MEKSDETSHTNKKRGPDADKIEVDVDKMLDGIISQQESYGLEEVFDGIVEAFLRKGASVKEFASIGWQSALYQTRGAQRQSGPPLPATCEK